MRIQFLTKAERNRLNQFPTEIPREDLITFFTLTDSDFSQIPQRVEKIVVTARQQAQEETYHQLNFLLTDERKEVLDKLLTPIEDSSRTQLFWLRHGAVSNTPEAILNNIEKLQFLYAAGVDQWNLSSLNPNRQKFLASIGRRLTNQVLQRMIETRRYPVLLAFLRQSLIDIIRGASASLAFRDELLDIFDRCLWDTYTRGAEGFRL